MRLHWFKLINTTWINKGVVAKKIPDVGGLVTTTFLDTKIKEVNNKIPNVSGLVKKTDYDVKISEIEGK